MLCAKKHELKNMFKSHFKFYSEQKPNTKGTHKLILFYAVECGLKVKILDKINGNTTNDMINHIKLKDKLLGKDGHNISFMLKFLGYGQFSLPPLPCRNTQVADCRDYNQVWRYGIQTDAAKESLIEDELFKIANWIEGRI